MKNREELLQEIQEKQESLKKLRRDIWELSKIITPKGRNYFYELYMAKSKETIQ